MDRQIPAGPDGMLSASNDADGLTRRRLLKLGGQGAAVLAGGAFLAACGANGAGLKGSSSTAASAGTPARGGTLNVGMISGGSAETLNPGLEAAWVDIMRTFQLYDPLFNQGSDIRSVLPGLATSAEHNGKATVWTIHLRDGVTWHDGKPFTADDVVWTIKSWESPANYGAFGYATPIDFKQVRKRGRLTVEIPLVFPVAEFPSLLTLCYLSIIQDGATPKSLEAHPIGTGPFKYVSFQPGSQSVFAANKDYWVHGGPYVDKLVINSSFTDETARYNALLGGQIEVSSMFPPNYAKQQASGGQVNVLSSHGGQGYVISMRVDKGPFTDVRVRQAMRLLCNREQMIENVFSGYGTVGNDIQGVGTQYFADDLKRTESVEQAKSLLKAAGRSDLAVSLQTSNASPGFVQSATLYAEQAQKAGVNVNVQTISPANYYTPAGGFLSRYFGQASGNAWPSQSVVAQTYFLKGAPFDETHWTSQAGGGDQKLLLEAIAATDPGKAQDLWHEAQQQQFDTGGEILWTYADWVDAAVPSVRGLTAGESYPLNNFRLLDAWIAS